MDAPTSALCQVNNIKGELAYAEKASLKIVYYGPFSLLTNILP